MVPAVPLLSLCGRSVNPVGLPLYIMVVIVKIGDAMKQGRFSGNLFDGLRRSSARIMTLPLN